MRAKEAADVALGRFRARTETSARMYQEAAKVAPGGVNAGIKFFEPYPLFMRRARGAHIWDVDGNEYIDYLMSYGALVLGHGHRAVARSIQAVLRGSGTTVFGTPTKGEVDYGRTLRDLYHPGGRVRFTNSGLEATLLAVRLARGDRRRRKVAKFEGHYHGAVDRLLFSYTPGLDGAGEPSSPVPLGDSVDVDEGILSESLVLPFNDWESTERLVTEHSDELACVIMEPFEEGVIPAERKFMAGLRGLTRDLKVPLIFDEVKTGFRVRLGGAGEYYGVTPDLTCLGKIVGGGLPVGAVVGDERIMAQLDPRGERKSRVFHSGTFNGNPMSISVGRATVEELSRKGRFDALCSRTEGLKRGMSAEMRRRQVPNVMLGEGGMFNYYITDRAVKNYRDARSSDMRTRRVVDIELISRGVYLKPENRYCLSLAHTADDVAETVERFGKSLDAVVQNSRQ